MKGNKKRELPSEYLWGPAGAPVFNVATAQFRKNNLSPGSQTHKVIQALTQDFYVPQKVGGLFTTIFSDEKFNIFSSPNRVYQAVSRTGNYFEEATPKNNIQRHRQNYFLKPSKEIAFLVSAEKTLRTWEVIHFENAKAALGTTTAHSPDEFKERLGLTPAEFKRLRNYLRENELVAVHGGGKYVRYQLTAKLISK